MVLAGVFITPRNLRSDKTSLVDRLSDSDSDYVGSDSEGTDPNRENMRE